MRRLDELQKVKALEILTIVVALIGILLSLIHGNLYDYFFNLFSIKDIWNFRITYVSLLTYSTLAAVVFGSLYFLDEKNPEKRFYSFIQGWLLITMAASAYELVDGFMNWALLSISTHQFPDAPYHFLTKRASVIFFGALFVFWILEQKKNQLKNMKPL